MDQVFESKRKLVAVEIGLVRCVAVCDCGILGHEQEAPAQHGDARGGDQHDRE